MSNLNIHLLQPGSIDPNTGTMLLEEGKKAVVVMHKAGWCGHCQKSKGAFQKAADKHSNTITFAAVDHSGTRGAKPASEESQIIAALASKHFGIRGFPTYTLHIDGVFQPDFDITDRSVEGIEAALMKALA
jgi:thiol-disulfide isomerase/thioredoxin